MLRVCEKTYWPKHLPQHNTNPQQFFLGARQAAGLSRGIFPGAGKRTVSNQTNHRAQKGYPAHIPRAARRPQILSPVQPKHAHIKRRQVRRSHQHSSDPAPARRKLGAPPPQKLTAQNASLGLAGDDFAKPCALNLLPCIFVKLTVQKTSLRLADYLWISI